jgi:putative transposase
MHRSHKIELKPNNKQKTYFAKACGISRFAYNWGLARWIELYEENKKLPKELQHRISWQYLSKEFNAIKYEQFPWTLEVTKYASQEPFRNLGEAFSNFFKAAKKKKEKAGSSQATLSIPYPQFKKKGKCRDSFYIGGDQTKVKGRHIWIPNLGFVRMKHQLRFEGKINSVTISRTADRWFASIQVELPNELRIINGQRRGGEEEKNNSIGVDLGVNRMITTSEGISFHSPKPLKQYLRKLKRASRQLSKKITAAKKEGRELSKSKNYQKQKLRVAKIHARIANIRKDTLHKITSCLVNNYKNIAIEDLNVSGMLKNHKLARAIADMGFYEFRRQLVYKSQERGVNLVIVDRFFPSSKCCSSCGLIKEDLSLKERTFSCECGFEIDRDVNAAINLKNQIGRVPAESTPVEITALQRSVFPIPVTSIVEAGSQQWAYPVMDRYTSV